MIDNIFDTFAYHFFAVSYVDCTSNQKKQVGTLVKTGETGPVKAQKKCRDAQKLHWENMKNGIFPQKSTLTPEQELRAEELARTLFKDSFCSICEARKKIIRDLITNPTV